MTAMHAHCIASKKEERATEFCTVPPPSQVPEITEAAHGVEREKACPRLHACGVTKGSDSDGGSNLRWSPADPID